MTVKRYPLKKRIDNRGWLLQNDYPQLSEKMKHFVISETKPGGIRGNHYHKKKREWFSVIKGKASLYLYNTKTKEEMSIILRGDEPEFIEIDPYVVHTLVNNEDEEFLFFEIVDHTFIENDSDTYLYKLK